MPAFNHRYKPFMPLGLAPNALGGIIMFFLSMLLMMIIDSAFLDFIFILIMSVSFVVFVIFSILKSDYRFYIIYWLHFIEKNKSSTLIKGKD